jgi:hypothetical protein
MANTLIPFPKKETVEPETQARSHSRVVFTIGNQRFAIDFFSRVTELNPISTGRVLAIDGVLSKKRPKSLK